MEECTAHVMEKCTVHAVSCPDLRDPVYVSVGLGRVWFGVGILCSIICISMFWPGRVLNQGQLSIVVSDWEPYLVAFFSTCLGGKFTLFRAHSIWDSWFVKLKGYVLFIVLFSVILIKLRKCMLTYQFLVLQFFERGMLIWDGEEMTFKEWPGILYWREEFNILPGYPGQVD